MAFWLAWLFRLSEATGERWAGHELSPGPPTPSGPGADQGGPGAGVVWPRPWRAREAGRRGTEDTRTLWPLTRVRVRRDLSEPRIEPETSGDWWVATLTPDWAQHQDSVSNGSDKVRGGQQTQRGASCQEVGSSAWLVCPRLLVTACQAQCRTWQLKTRTSSLSLHDPRQRTLHPGDHAHSRRQQHRLQQKEKSAKT